MKFILHEVKLWFKEKDSQPKSYVFLPNKINVITGDATTGKTSFWRIIDYCLLSNKPRIANTIAENVSWFGIRFTINEKEISIARKSPSKGAPISDVFFTSGSLPEIPIQNMGFTELKGKLDEEFGINDAVMFPFGREAGKTPLNISYRYFLIFNSLTEDIIGSSETYFDTTFYGREEYERILGHVFDMVIGVNDMANIKAQEKILSIEGELKKINKQIYQNQSKEKDFKNGIFNLVAKLKEVRLLDNYEEIDSIDKGLIVIEEIISSSKIILDNTKIFAELDTLNKRTRQIRVQLSNIESYRKEYDAYKKTLNRSADSLKPIEFLNKNLSDQLIDSYETKSFMEVLETSLKEIQTVLSKYSSEPLKVSGDAQELQKELKAIEARISQLNLISKDFLNEGAKLMAVGEVKYAREQLLKNFTVKPIDQTLIKQLNSERLNLESSIQGIEQTKFVMKKLLNDCIQRNYNLLNSLPKYKNSETLFNETEMILQLKPRGQFFVLDNVGSKSNYMFMHLCFYLGLHEHILNVSPEHVPQFLFIDQPSIPYYSGNDTMGNDDKSKLIDAFSLLNSFIDYITIEKKSSFQIFMVEHAPKEYWIENNLSNFHTVAEFINGNGLIPQHILTAEA